jgi:hypothetical protein
MSKIFVECYITNTNIAKVYIHVVFRRADKKTTWYQAARLHQTMSKIFVECYITNTNIAKVYIHVVFRRADKKTPPPPQNTFRCRLKPHRCRRTPAAAALKPSAAAALKPAAAKNAHFFAPPALWLQQPRQPRPRLHHDRLP